MEKLRSRLEGVWASLEELGWEWVDRGSGTERLQPPRTDDPASDLLARDRALQAIDATLEAIENDWIALPDNERKDVTDARVEAIRLRESLPFDNAMSKLRHEAEAIAETLAAHEERIHELEGEVRRFTSGVWRGAIAIVLGFIASWLIAPGMEWSRGDVALIWLTILVVWLAVWRVRATK